MSQSITPFICVDGINGCGKSTFCKEMKQLLPDLQYIKLPDYTTETGKQIQKFLKDGEDNEFIDCLFNQNRLEVEDKVKELLNNKVPVIMDRSYLSQQVYFHMRNNQFDWDQEHIVPTHLFVLLPNPDDCYAYLKERPTFYRYYGRKNLHKASDLFKIALTTDKIQYGNLFTVNQIYDKRLLKAFVQKMAEQIATEYNLKMN